MLKARTILLWTNLDMPIVRSGLAHDRCKSPRAMPAGQYLMPHYDGRPPGARIPNRSRSLWSDEFCPSRIRPTQNGFWMYYGGPLSLMDKGCPIAAAQLRILATIGPCRFTITVTILASWPFFPSVRKELRSSSASTRAP